MNQIICDDCRRPIHPSEAQYKLHREGPETLGGSINARWDFCSANCLAAWAVRQPR